MKRSDSLCTFTSVGYMKGYKVFVGDIPKYVTAQTLHSISDRWLQEYRVDRPITVDFNNRRKSKSIVANRPKSATLTFSSKGSATAWVKTAKELLFFEEGQCKVQFCYYGFEERWWSDNRRR